MAENLTRHYTDHGIGNDLLDQSLDRLSVLGENVSLGTQDEKWAQDHNGSKRVHLLQEKVYPRDVGERLVAAQDRAVSVSEQILSSQASILRKEQLLKFWQDDHLASVRANELEAQMKDLHPASDNYQALANEQRSLRTAQGLKSCEEDIHAYLKSGQAADNLDEKLAKLSEQGLGTPIELIDTYKQIHSQKLLADLSPEQLQEYLKREGQSERVQKVLQGEVRRREIGSAFDQDAARQSLHGSIASQLGDDPYAPRIAQMMGAVTVEDMSVNSQMYKGLDLGWSVDENWQEHQHKMHTDLTGALLQKPDLDFDQLEAGPDQAFDLT